MEHVASNFFNFNFWKYKNSRERKHLSQVCEDLKRYSNIKNCQTRHPKPVKYLQLEIHASLKKNILIEMAHKWVSLKAELRDIKKKKKKQRKHLQHI